MYIKYHILKDNALHYDNYVLYYRCKPLTVEAVERIIKIACEKAKVRGEIRCSPNTCIHYYSQSQLRNGLDIYSLLRILGHETVDITKRYLQSIKDETIIEMSVETSPLMNLR